MWPALSAFWTCAKDNAGNELDPANRQVPRKLAISSPSMHASTKICGRLNWTSRSLNGSSLKRPRQVDPSGQAVEAPCQQQERGAFLWLQVPEMPRETG